MKIILLCLTISLWQNSIAQNNYQLFVFEEIRNELITTNSLYINLKKSFWVQDSNAKVIISEKDESIQYKLKNSKYRYKLFKDIEQGKIYHNYKLLNKVFYVKDSLSNMNWKILDSTQILLGYKCQIAKTKFRGRVYFASFTSEIKTQNGPWKFHGLPGMILKVNTDKNNGGEFYKMECIEIKRHNEDIEDDYQHFVRKNKFITWEQLKKEFIRFMNNTFKKLKSSYQATDTELGEVTLKIKNKKEIINKEYQLQGVTKDMN